MKSPQISTRKVLHLPLINNNSHYTISKRSHKNYTVDLSKSIINRNKSIQSGYMSKILKQFPLMEKSHYQYFQTDFIKKEYIKLLNTIKKMNKKCNEVIQKSTQTITIHGKNKSSSSLSAILKQKSNLLQKIQQNNLTLILNQDLELKKLLEKIQQLMNPFIKKQTLIQEIQNIQQEIKKQKKKLNKDENQTNRLSKQLVDIDKIQQETRPLQAELNCLLKRKLILQQKTQKLLRRNQILKKNQLEQHEKICLFDGFQSNQKFIIWQKNDEDFLRQQLIRKQKHIEILKKDKENKQKTKMKKYYGLLKQLQIKNNGLQLLEQKEQKIQEEIQTKQTLYSKIMNEQNNEQVMTETDQFKHEYKNQMIILQEVSDNLIKTQQNIQKLEQKQQIRQKYTLSFFVDQNINQNRSQKKDLTKQQKKQLINPSKCSPMNKQNSNSMKNPPQKKKTIKQQNIYSQIQEQQDQIGVNQLTEIRRRILGKGRIQIGNNHQNVLVEKQVNLIQVYQGL